MLEVGVHSGTEFEADQEGALLAALRDGLVTAEQVNEAWTTQRDDESYIGGRWLQSQIRTFARKYPEYAPIAALPSL